jgi:hypothetical protein
MYVLTMRRTVGSLALWLGVGIFAVILAILVGTIVNTMRKVEPVRAKKPPVSAVPWGDRVFFGPGTLHHWLKVHGIAYSVWAERHPPADKLLQREKARREAKLKKK